MGFCCSKRKDEEERAGPHEVLENHNRWRTFALPLQKDVLCAYDFQDRTAQVIRPVFPIKLVDYSHIYLWPLVYVVGGVDADTGEVTNKVWASSANEGGDSLHFAESTPMFTARKKPFLVCPRVGTLYAISGYYHSQLPMSKLATCEKFSEGSNVWQEMPPLRSAPGQVFTVGEYIYAFAEVREGARFERLDTGDAFAHWEEIVLASAGVEFGLEERYGISAGRAGRVLVFGGIDAMGRRSRGVYAIDVQTGVVSKESQELKEDGVMTECWTDSATNTYYVTDELRLCVYDKGKDEWRFEGTDIKKAARKLGVNID